MTVRKTDAEDLSQEARIRANLYQIFAAFFLTPPSEPFLSELASNPVPGFPTDGSWDASALHLEFHALFLVPATQYVFPYESCYRGRRDARPGRLMGTPALDVQEFYRRAGFDLSPETSELPDHAGLEFSFLQVMAEKEAAAWQHGAEEQARHWRALQTEFLDDHAARWIPALCAEITTHATHPYFTGFAGWIRSTIEEATLAKTDCAAACPEASPDLGS